MKRILTSLLLSAALTLPLEAPAQGLFSPAITVNEQAVTYYEIDQRKKLLKAFRTPGDLDALAREQLVDDRLRLALTARTGMSLTDQGLQNALDEFAARGNMDYPTFVSMLKAQGIDEQTMIDYVRANVTWRDYIRINYGDRVEITESDIEAALENALGSSTELQVLLSEIIIPAPPPRAAEAMRIAERIASYTTTGAFSAAAREYSALPTRENGGRLGWKSLDEYPAGLHNVLLDLEPGEVTAPLPIQNGVALFQLRDVREVTGRKDAPAKIDYATYAIAGGLSEEGLAQAARVDTLTDSCDDLYGVAQGQPEEVLTRQSVTPSEIPSDIAMVLAGLDTNESAATLTRNDGQTLLYVMLCSRVPAAAQDIDRDTLRERVRSRALASYADALLAELRASAVVVNR